MTRDVTKRIKLIQPRVRRGHGSSKNEQGRLSAAPPTLPYVAGLTPAGYDVSIVDENFDEINFEDDVDLVGISVLTMVAPRAYEIAEAYRKRGVPVVLGGPHPTLVPDEAIGHADAIVVGEAEEVWPTLLADFRNGGLQKVYERTSPCSLDHLPHPRWDLLNTKSYLTANLVQASRGCPYNCSFCSITRMFGATHRTRPISDVVRELEAMTGRLMAFTDPDIAANRRFSKELFEAIAHCNKIWVADSGIRIAGDDELLRAAAKAGCKGLYIGLESVSSASLREAGKRQNRVPEYAEVVERIHQHGISVLAGFVFGFDGDDEGVFERTVEFAVKSKLDYADFNVLCPYPGTRVYEQFQQEGRLIESDWSRYFGGVSVVFRPKQMSAERLAEGTRWAWKQFYSRQSILQRFVSRHNMTSLVNPVGYLILNFSTRRSVAALR